jgi:hypothetical protein
LSLGASCGLMYRALFSMKFILMVLISGGMLTSLNVYTPQDVSTKTATIMAKNVFNVCY